MSPPTAPLPPFDERPLAAAMSRRGFLRTGLAAGAGLGLPALLAGCLDDVDAEPLPAGREQRTLFFDLSHLPHAGRVYYLTGGGQRYQLESVKSRPEVLADASQRNEFLRSVPAARITHHIEGAVFDTAAVTITFLHSDLDTQAGTWQMEGVLFNIPSTGSAHAYAHARRLHPHGPLPLSAKRRRYGVRAAASEQDLRDERVLIDPTAQAAAIIGAHPDLMSLEPNSAHAVHSNYVDVSIDTLLLSETLSDTTNYGPAQPQQTAGKKNATGWATLVPVTDDNGQSLRNTLGNNAGRIQYQPQLHPDIAQAAGSGAEDIVPAVRDDTTFGQDVTGAQPPSDPNADPDPARAGGLWFRHDGIAHGSGAPGATATDAFTMTLVNGTPGDWVWPSASSSANPDNSVQVTVDLLNWGLRFLGVYVQFLSTKTDPPTVLPLAQIPEYQSVTIVPKHDNGLDSADTMFLGMLGPVFTILGIPTAPGFLLPSLRVPASADQVRVLSGGLSFQGGNSYPDTVLAGAIMTGIFNYGVTALMAAAGAGATFSVVLKEVVIPFAQAMALELITIISAALAPSGPTSLIGLLGSASFWEGQALAMAKFLLTRGAGVAVGKLVAAVTAELGEAAVQDAIPVAGWIMLGVSITVGVVSLAETSAELALSPWTFIDDLTFTHDLSVTLRPDPNDDTFPKAANQYIVTAMFSDGTPKQQTFTIDPSQPVPATLPPVVFAGVPLGGQVEITVAFHQTATATTSDVLLGKGSTGLIANDASGVVPDIVITELKFPIDAATQYQHRQKLTLDANDQPQWTGTAVGPSQTIANTSCAGPGTVCSYRSITVRQGTSAPPLKGYVGYAFQSQPTQTAAGCSVGGQLDTVVNVGTAVASDGFVTTACPLPVGVKVAYNLTGSASAHYYLDTQDSLAPMLRQVVLDPTPSFDATSSNRAWGVLNFNPDALLLHPAGHVIALNTAAHKMEVHKLPGAPLADAAARTQLLARVQGGLGTRPGLMTAPQHAAVGSDGTIVILEQGNSATGVPARLQALNLGGNPVPYFSKQSAPYFLALTATPNSTSVYLDLAVEAAGFIYLLSYDAQTTRYRLDIYHPTQAGTAPISTTYDVNAARLAVDFWRNVYTLNYEVLVRATPGLTQPSVSLWVPSESCVGVPGQCQ